MFTEEQKKAFSIDKHLSVIANAGSGKTTVLVERFINILLNAGQSVSLVNHPKNIVAITFTRKAASEMLSRIVSKIEKEIEEAKTPGKLEFFKTIREGLSHAKIMTIHSFCASLLRDYPIESNISPNFIEMTEIEQISMWRNSLFTVLEDWLDGFDERKKDIATDLFRKFGKTEIENIIYKIVYKREILESVNNFLTKSAEEILNLRNQIFIREIFFDFQKKLYQIKSILSQLDNNFKENKKANLNNLIDQIDYLLNLKFTDSDPTNQIINLFDIFNEVKNAIFTQKLILKSGFKKQLNFREIFLIENNFSVAFLTMSKFYEAFSYEEKDKELIFYARRFFELANNIIEEANEIKKSEGKLDFDDLLLKAAELLKFPSISQKIANRIKFLMVDEFQDTNFLQYSIINNILNFNGKLKTRKTNLFIVGDMKQSIYGFRNSDVRVFKEAIKDITTLNHKNLQQQEENNELLGNLKLTSTFRLQPTIASFVNTVCNNIMNDHESEFDVNYEHFIVAKSIDKLKQEHIDNQEIFSLEKKLGSVGFLLKIKEKNSNESEEDDTSISKESDLIANYINNLILNKKKLISDKEGTRNIKYSDIAILGRKKAGFGELAESFTNAGIPYIIHSGTGFYETQEITDLLSFLKFIQNNLDDNALLEILRSPYLNVSDDEITEISQIKNQQSVWHKLNSYCSKKTQFSKSHRALKILTEISNFAYSLSIPQLLGKIIELCGWYGTLAGTPQRNQIVANIEKFIAKTREFENTGFKNLYDFVEELRFISSQNVNESEAVFLSGEDAVNIMTIHSSKGLEFPVVFLFNTNSSTKQGNSINISEKFGVTFPLPIINEEGFKEKIKSPLAVLNDIYNRRSELAEEKRILYVAMTRAKDHLIISGTIYKNSEGEFSKLKGFMKLIFDGLNIFPKNLINTDFIEFCSDLRILKDEKIDIIKFKYEIDNLNKYGADKISVDSHFKIPNNFDILVKEIDTVQEKEIFSPSRLMLFENDRESYIKKYFLGLPDLESTEFRSDYSFDNDEDNIIFTLAGTLIHQVLEKIPSWVMKDGQINNEFLDNIIMQSIQNQNKNVHKKLKDRILLECLNVAQTPLIKKNLSNLMNSRQEYELNLFFNNDFMSSKFDILIKNDSGEFEIWDWKTNKMDSQERKNKLVNEYELQMKIYSWLVSKLYPEQNNFTARLLFTRLAKINAPDDAWTHTYSWNKEDLIEFDDILKDKIKQIKTIE